MTPASSKHRLSLTPSSIASVVSLHRKRTGTDLDAKSSIEVTTAVPTACWSWSGDTHHIRMGEYLPEQINTPAMLSAPRGKRKETIYAQRVMLHEVAHAIYSSRDFGRINDLCKKHKVSFRLLNLFEDARIEALFRQRRPTKVNGKRDLDYLGRFQESETYGVRKFEWIKWDKMDVSTPANTFLAFIIAEGTKANVSSLKTIFHTEHGMTMPDAFRLANGDLPEVATAFAIIQGYWRLIAGKGASKRFSTTESVFKLLELWRDQWATPEGNESHGPGDDFVESCAVAIAPSGEKPHEEKSEPSEPSEPKPSEEGDPEPKPEPKDEGDKGEKKEEKYEISADKDTRETWHGVHDHKHGGTDESVRVLTERELEARGLTSAYFEIEVR